MSLNRRLKKIEKLIKGAKLDEPLLPVIEIVIGNREQAELAMAVDSDELRFTREEQDELRVRLKANKPPRILPFYEFFQRLPNEAIPKEDLAAWEEQAELSYEREQAYVPQTPG